jgi:hypothetical protein
MGGEIDGEAGGTIGLREGIDRHGKFLLMDRRD